MLYTLYIYIYISIDLLSILGNAIKLYLMMSVLIPIYKLLYFDLLNYLVYLLNNKSPSRFNNTHVYVKANVICIILYIYITHRLYTEYLIIIN